MQCCGVVHLNIERKIQSLKKYESTARNIQKNSMAIYRKSAQICVAFRKYQVRSCSSCAAKNCANPLKPAHDFSALVDAISRMHDECAVAVNRTVNTTLTLRNWVIGFYIVEYEIECIRGNWSVRALKRQIATLYYERSGLSLDKEKLADMAHSAAEKADPRLAIRDPYLFEFLGLKASETVSESNLEAALLENLHEFLMELGHGFCLEARQKSIVIGKTRGFVDLVFYHRILKCHVLIELKVDKFTHEHLGQLNTYVSWYRKHMMTDGDNPPVGLLLCTQKDHALVEYAIASMDNRLFVSKYQLELPKKEELELFLQTKRREITEG